MSCNLLSVYVNCVSISEDEKKEAQEQKIWRKIVMGLEIPAPVSME